MTTCPSCSSERVEGFDVCWNCNYDFINKKIAEVKSNPTLHELESAKEIDCLRCKIPMEFKSSLEFHEGNDYGILGELGHFLNSKLKLKMYICPSCHKVEFYV
jgi:hypothetical protein